LSRCAVSLYAASAQFFGQAWVDVWIWDEEFTWCGAQRFSDGMLRFGMLFLRFKVLCATCNNTHEQRNGYRRA
jgi:hypothetical protein